MNAAGNRTASHRIRIFFLAGVSAIALAAAGRQGMAADLTPARAPVYKAAPLQGPIVTMFLEGGAFWTAGKPAFTSLEGDGGDTRVIDALGISGVRSKPGWGWWGAGGIDYQWAGSPWHVSAAFRYGRSRSRSQNFACSPGGPSCFNNSSASASAGVTHKEQHWVADFMVGRDVGLGSGQAQLKFGLRVANLKSRTNALGNYYYYYYYSSSSMSFTKQQKSKFLGVGPRIALDGSVSLSGAWVFDYGLGAAALFGDRDFSVSVNGVNNGVGFAFSRQLTKSSTVFNADASAALGYWLTPNFKVAAGYRFDGYWNGLIQLDENFNQESMNRFYHGPFIRATGKF